MPIGDDPGHVPVLPAQILELLNPQPGMVCLDCTLGRAGHAAIIAPRLAPGGRYIGLDVDPGNIAFARQRLADAPVPVDLVQANFTTAREVLQQRGLGKVDILLADLGFASTQMDDPDRGFSFSQDGPLDMRLDPTLPTTAADLVNHLPERELADVIYRYGEERLSRRIARKIAEQRQREPILTTWALARVIHNAFGPRRGHDRIDPATRTFMALRIAVNAELEALEQLLASLTDTVAQGGAAAIISFHSLEDRLVKQAFAKWRQEGLAERITRKPVVADDDERRSNPRSRSAKLRVIRFLPLPAEPPV